MLVEQGLPRAFAADVATLAGGVARGDLAVTTDAVRELIGRGPRDARDFLDAHRDELRQVVPST